MLFLKSMKRQFNKINPVLDLCVKVLIKICVSVCDTGHDNLDPDTGAGLCDLCEIICDLNTKCLSLDGQ